ncbi:class I SAM-dependent methyltransferase [Glutamicibacter sp. V16R2B1]|uniref:class I SAM-dependent methyltransferase n=1 Tax=Glutamicibacter sp. V16R2B1 TaxID=2036207 RepID=UPI001484D7B7|nr:class I SAM-dependent methyltransferase [Glutamicibacter sp. V16R2B1]
MGEQYAARLVDLYDADNPDGPDHDYYRELAARHVANSILDLGCGTGILTVTFAGPGRQVTGVDPSAAMLDYARRHPGAQAVRWIHGDSRLLPDGPYDLMVMTGNVAQHIADPQWQRTLSDPVGPARPGGCRGGAGLRIPEPRGAGLGNLGTGGTRNQAHPARTAGGTVHCHRTRPRAGPAAIRQPLSGHRGEDRAGNAADLPRPVHPGTATAGGGVQGQRGMGHLAAHPLPGTRADHGVRGAGVGLGNNALTAAP